MNKLLVFVFGCCVVHITILFLFFFLLVLCAFFYIGMWSEALSCYDVALQDAPNHLSHRLGVLRCQRNLGHIDTMLRLTQGLYCLFGWLCLCLYCFHYPIIILLF